MRSRRRPGVIDAKRQEIMVPADIWAGQLARARVTFYAYQVSGNTGCSLMLESVQVVKQDMPRMDGRIDPSRAFDPVGEQDIPAEYRGMTVRPAANQNVYQGEMTDDDKLAF